MKLRRTVPLVAAALATLPAAANAATLTVDKSCYRPGLEARVAGTGYTPFAPVAFTLDGAPFGTEPLLADAAGNLQAQFTAGAPTGKEQKFTLGASDGTNSAETSFTTTQLDVGVTPKRGNPAKRKKVVARGWDRGKVLRFHVRGPRKRNGKVGKAKGPCGKLRRKVRIFGATYPPGVYTVQFDQRKKYKKRANPSVIFNVQIFRVFRLRFGAFGGIGETWQRVR